MTLPSLLCENAAQGFTEAAEAHLARVSKATNEPDYIVCDLATTSGLPATPASSGAQSDSVAEGVLADVQLVPGFTQNPRDRALHVLPLPQRIAMVGLSMTSASCTQPFLRYSKVRTRSRRVSMLTRTE